MNYSTGQYRDTETGRHRWGVFCGHTRVWYFASRYGQKAAKAFCDRLNREITRERYAERGNDYWTE